MKKPAAEGLRLFVFFTLFLVLDFGSGLLRAQDVGMGSRAGGSTRLEHPYTLEVETPHTKWAKPLPGGPLRVLAVPSVQEGRTLVELAQRFDLDLTTVSIDPAWDVNKWTMAFGEDYGARAEQGDLTLVYRYLEEELISRKTFEVIFLPLHHGWEALTPASRDALRKRVSEGCGLVLIRPFDRELSPLIPVSAVAEPQPPYEPIEPDFESSPWRRVGDHYITRAIPIEAFPFQFIQHYRYGATQRARVLVESESGVPILAEQTVGKGLVVAFGFRNIGMSWRMPFDAAGEAVNLHWEYFYALLGRALMYAGRRAPDGTSGFDTADQQWVLRTEEGAGISQGTGKPGPFEDLRPGRYFLEKRNSADWMISTIDIEQPDRIEGIRVTPAVISEGDILTVRFTSSGATVVELEDGFGRVISRVESSAGPGEKLVELRAGRPLTHGGCVRFRVGTARASRTVRFAASSREWTDYEVIMPWYGPNSYQPWTAALDARFRELGITTMEDPQRPFKVIASVHEPAFGIYWYRRENYEKRKAEYLRTGDKSFLRRDVSLESPNLLEEIRSRFIERVEDSLPLRPFAYYLADESSLTCYADAFDVDWSSESIAAFRSWLQERYRDLAELNRTWNTRFGDWEDVLPMTSQEAQAHGNYAPWSEHRVFMEERFVATIKRAGEIARELDPGARASFSGTQVPTAHNGCNWYEIDQVTDYLQPYSGGNQDSMHYLFNPELRLTGFTGYGLTEVEVQKEVWRRLFYGHSGASIFWHYTLMNPDLTFSSQGRGLANAFGRIQSGVGRIFLNSRVIEDGVAVHFSMASIRGAWITDGRIVEGVRSAVDTSENFKELMQRRHRWVQALEKRGIQFRFLATPQVEAGELRNYHTLILPYSIALSDAEAAEIERFAARGGTVYIDDQTGRMDEKCRWRNQQLWTGQTAHFVRGTPEEAPFARAIPISGDFLTTIRSFGDARIFGLLPEGEVEVTLPPADRVRYDLFRSQVAEETVAANPAKPVLMLERPHRIAAIRIDPGLTVHLADEQGEPIDRSVVQVAVLNPKGSKIGHYSGNIDLRQGTGKIVIPFALNDPAGEWTIEARDVISGLSATFTLVRP